MSPASRARTQDDTPDSLARHLQREAPLPVYAIIGDEPFARTQAIQAIRQALLKDAEPDLALSEYQGAEAPEAAQVLDELRTPAFLAPRRLVVIEDAAPFVARAGEVLAGYLKKPSATGTLVLVVEKLAKNDKLGIAVRKAGMAVACAPPREYELPRWIAARAREHGKRIDTAAAKRLAEYVGVNLPVLEQSLIKLSLYVGQRPAIAEADVEALVEDLPATTIFKLTDAVGSKEPARALRVLDNLLEQNNDASYILSMIRWALERLINARTLLDLKQTPAAIAKALRMRPGYFLDQTLQQARRRTRAELRRGFALLLQADLDTKTSVAPPRDLLEHLLIRLCA